MKKLMMAVAAVAAMTMTTTAATPIIPQDTAETPSITAAWVDGEYLCFTTSPDIGQVLGRNDEHLVLMFGTVEDGGYFNEKMGVFGDYLAHTIHYPTIEGVTGHADEWPWSRMFETFDRASVSLCYIPDGSTASYVYAKLGTLNKGEDGTWTWAGRYGRTGVVGSSAPVVEDDDDDEPVVDPEPEQNQTKCPVLSFFRKLFGKR